MHSGQSSNRKHSRKDDNESNPWLVVCQGWEKARHFGVPLVTQPLPRHRYLSPESYLEFSERAKRRLNNRSVTELRKKAQRRARKFTHREIERSIENSKFMKAWNKFQESKHRKEDSPCRSQSPPLSPPAPHNGFKALRGYNKDPPSSFSRRAYSDSDDSDDYEFKSSMPRSSVSGVEFGTNDDLVNDLPDTFKECFQIRDVEQKKKSIMMRKTYVPPKKTIEELFDDIEEGPMFDEMKNAKIEISGGDTAENSSRFLESFDDCKFSPILFKNIRHGKRYTIPTPIQKVVIPILQHKSDYDVIAHAQTGGGKTAAYLLPIIDMIHKLKVHIKDGINNGHPYAIVIAPTRELAKQLWEDACAFAHGTHVKACVSYGKIDMPENKREIRNGCDLLIATTGRLMHFYNENAIYLDRVVYFVMDEADRLMETSVTFLDDVQLLVAKMPTQRRTFLFSATFNKDAQEIAEKLVRPGHFFITIGVLNSVVENVEHEFIEVTRLHKKELLHKVLLANASVIGKRNGKPLYKVPKTLIFVERKRTADRLAIELCCNGFKAWSINSDRPQILREEALESFEKEDESSIAVATSLLSRGFNIKNLHNVINYDLPTDPTDYVHRIGRAGRKGNTGYALSFFDSNRPTDRQVAPHIVDMLIKAKKKVPDFMNEYYKSHNFLF